MAQASGLILPIFVKDTRCENGAVEDKCSRWDTDGWRRWMNALEPWLFPGRNKNERVHNSINGILEAAHGSVNAFNVLTKEKQFDEKVMEM